jgi:glutamine amidotransferase
MILALGAIDPVGIALAARDMGEGRTARHRHPVRRHPDGWGAIWTPDHGDADPRVVRDAGPIGDADMTGIFGGVRAGLLAVHARHASDPRNRGPAFTHPVIGQGRAMLHNGFAPNIAALLGRPCSVFDTAELLEYLFPPAACDPSPAQLRASLRAVGPGMTAANSFVVTPASVFIVNWFDEALGFADFYTLWTLRSERSRIFASEIVPALGAAESWRPLGHGTVISLPRCRRTAP